MRVSSGSTDLFLSWPATDLSSQPVGRLEATRTGEGIGFGVSAGFLMPQQTHRVSLTATPWWHQRGSAKPAAPAAPGCQPEENPSFLYPLFLLFSQSHMPGSFSLAEMHPFIGPALDTAAHPLLFPPLSGTSPGISRWGSAAASSSGPFCLAGMGRELQFPALPHPAAKPW